MGNNTQTKEVGDLKKELDRIERKISANRKELFKRHLKFPVLNPTFYGAAIGLIGYMGFSLIFAQYIKNFIYQVIITTLLPFIIVLIAVFWGDIPEENINNGNRVIELKQETYTLKRHRRIYRQILKKGHQKWNKDDEIRISFESLEA